VLGLADRVIALRDGRVVADQPAASLDHDQMVRLIAGRAVADLEVGREAQTRRPVLRASGLAGEQVKDVSLELGAGEIVGVSGILGSGREELAALLFGASHRAAGYVEVLGEELICDDTAAAIDAGMGYVPGDRRRGGAVMEMNVRENLTLPLLRPLRRRMWRFRLVVLLVRMWRLNADPRRNLPEAVLGTSSTISISRGALYTAIRSRQKEMSSPGSTWAPLTTETKAFTVSPR
jgi:ABC-type sugar transport system ATPase subunit